MADQNHKWSLNVEGSFFVDKNCIACDACTVEAPLFFKMNDKDGHAYVYAHPKNQKEIDLCNEALNLCPVDAIGQK